MEKTNNMEIMIMNFSGIYREEHFYERIKTTWAEVQGIPGTNCYCDDEAAEVLRDKIREFPVKGIHFIDSGNYHYMSRIWLEKMNRPFRLLVFDNHTDMQLPAFGGILSCGGWIAAALEELPLLKEVLLCGPDEEAFCQVPEELKGRVRFLSREKLKAGQMEAGQPDAGRKRGVQDFFAEIPADMPVYLSIDKDILCPEDACTAWSQGDLRRRELLEYLEIVLEKLESMGQQLAGVDICGECSPDEGNSDVNDASNRALLEFFRNRKG